MTKANKIRNQIITKIESHGFKKDHGTWKNADRKTKYTFSKESYKVERSINKSWIKVFKVNYDNDLSPITFKVPNRNS